MQRNNSDLIAIGALALLAAALSTLLGSVASGALSLVKAALAVPFVLFLPGYALSAALLPDGRAGLAERIAISAGLSIAVAALGGLLLNFMPSGLNGTSWRFLLLGVTLTSAAYALWRRQAHGIAGPGPLVSQVSIREVALVGSAALLIGLALGLGALGLNPTASEAAGNAAFTQLWALPKPEGGQQRVIEVGLHNYEDQSVTYRVTLSGGGSVFAEWPQVTVKNGESWQAQATVPGFLAGKDITADAYREGDTKPYRHVRVAGVYEGGG